MHRSLHDAMCIVKRTLESNAVVPGGGAVETALSVYMDSLAETMVRSKKERKRERETFCVLTPLVTCGRVRASRWPSLRLRKPCS